MNIGVNTRLLLPNKLEGIGWFTFEVLSRITVAHPEHTFFLFFDRPFDDKFVFSDNCVPIVVSPQARHPILYKIWFDYAIPRALKKHKIDIFLSPDGFLSKRTHIPQIAVMHDLNFEYFPEDLPKKDANYYKNNFPKFAKIAKQIITVSENSKKDIQKFYNIDSSKITVAYNGANELFKPLEESQKQKYRKQYSQSKPYFIYVGALHKRKNIVRMLQAYDEFIEKTGADILFLIVGEKMFKNPEIDAAYNNLKHKEKVKFTGRLEPVDLVKVVGTAKAMVYVSYFEGFGIPVLEALQCGVPVLTANLTSLPEVGGDVAIYCNPMDVKSICSGMEKVYQQNFNLDELLAQANKFNWNNTADSVWKVIEKAIL